MENKLLMAHQVAGYPEDETAITAAEALIAGGTGILEVQLAFSDPSADGVAIQTACSTVLSKGYTVKQGLEYISKIRKLHPEIPGASVVVQVLRAHRLQQKCILIELTVHSKILHYHTL